MTPDQLAARLKSEAAGVGTALTDGQTAQLIQYLQLITRWKRAAALTAVGDPFEAARVHVADSLLCLRAGLAEGAGLIDVGSGAGLPGIPLAIARPDLHVTLLEANRRKAGFLERAAAELGLDVRVLAGRAEDVAAGPPVREAYDVVTARAVAPLPILAELTLPLARVGGRAVLLKGPRVHKEIASARGAIATLGGDPPALIEAVLLGGLHRAIVVVPKARPTPHGFPRRPGVPQKAPL